MTPDNVLLAQCLTQSSSEKPPPAVDGNKHRDPKLGNVQRVRGLETFRPKWGLPSNPFPQGTGNSAEAEEKRW